MIRFHDVAIRQDDSAISIRVGRLELPTDRRCMVVGEGGHAFVGAITGIYPHAGSINRYCELSFPAGYLGAFAPEKSLSYNIELCCACYGKDLDVVSLRMRDFDLLVQHDRVLQTLPSSIKMRFSYALCYALQFDCNVFVGQTGVGDAAFRQACSNHAAKGCILLANAPLQAAITADYGIWVTKTSVEVFPHVRQFLQKIREASPIVDLA